MSQINNLGIQLYLNEWAYLAHHNVGFTGPYRCPLFKISAWTHVTRSYLVKEVEKEPPDCSSSNHSCSAVWKRAAESIHCSWGEGLGSPLPKSSPERIDFVPLRFDLYSNVLFCSHWPGLAQFVLSRSGEVFLSTHTGWPRIVRGIQRWCFLTVKSKGELAPVVIQM